MLLDNYTEKLIGLQDIKVEKVVKEGNIIHIYAKVERKSHKCPKCGKMTNYVHDYREQIIKDIPSFGCTVLIHLKKRRYRCSCGKRFQEDNAFLPRYYRITKRLIELIINKLRNVSSYTSIAKDVGLSTSTVIRYFDLISYPKPKLPEVLSIDEFKGNTGSEKYQCIITDPVNKIVLDIFPKRYTSHLDDYFNSYSREERNQVKYFVSDMWKPYADMASAWLKNAIQVVDKYHWIRQVTWSFESVRKQVQKDFSATHRKYFKHSKKLLLKPFNSLDDEQKQQVNIMLYASPTLSSAYFYKEKFQKIFLCKNIESVKNQFFEWINIASECSIPQFSKCAKTFFNWLSGILNSLSSNITNGFTEGCNNKIKVLKRNAYGLRNFTRFRNRILHIFSHQTLY